MSRREPSSEIDLQALFESGKEVPRQPEQVRARVLARARATLAAPMSMVAPPPAAKAHWPRYAVNLAASAACALGLAGAVYALSGRWSHGQAKGGAPPATIVSGSSARVPAAVTTSVVAEPPAPPSTQLQPAADVAAAPDSARPHGRRPAEPQAAYDAELKLMRSAHTAYAAHAFSNALVLVSEHARRFPNGLLAEEREALRVRCLLGSGRSGEARRAAAAFATRFPRSVLLQRIQAEVGVKAP